MIRRATKPGVVTIGIPTRNRSDYVTRAVRSALAQTHSEIEIVVSDNASADDTVQRIERINDSRVVLLKQSANIGMVGNFNACLKAATGELFLMLSDDDILDPEAIAQLSRGFHDPPNGLSADSIGLTWCPCIIVNSNGDALWVSKAGPLLESSLSMITALYNGNRGPRFCSVMVRTADALSVGGYDERHGAICDNGNWTQVALRYKYVLCIDRPLARYTMHAVSETSRSGCQEWQQFGENVFADVVKILRARSDANGEKQLRAANRNHIADLVVTVLMQTVGQHGWISNCAREIWRARHYMVTPFVARRLLKDGWKLLRLRRQW